MSKPVKGFVSAHVRRRPEIGESGRVVMSGGHEARSVEVTALDQNNRIALAKDKLVLIDNVIDQAAAAIRVDLIRVAAGSKLPARMREDRSRIDPAPLLCTFDLECLGFWLPQIGYHQGSPGHPNFLFFEQRL
jgi:hypothetical protein